MNRKGTLVRVEQLLDIFHDGFHKLFGSPERRLRKTRNTPVKASRMEREALERERINKEVAKGQDLDIERPKLMDGIERERTVKERLESLETDGADLSHDRGIEL